MKRDGIQREGKERERRRGPTPRVRRCSDCGMLMLGHVVSGHISTTLPYVTTQLPVLTQPRFRTTTTCPRMILSPSYLFAAGSQAKPPYTGLPRRNRAVCSATYRDPPSTSTPTYHYNGRPSSHENRTRGCTTTTTTTTKSTPQHSTQSIIGSGAAGFYTNSPSTLAFILINHKLTHGKMR